MNLKEFCQEAESNINSAESFIKYRMALHNYYFQGLIFSTSHGTDIFKNVIKCLDGGEWKEEGEYGRNFKEGIKRHYGQNNN